MEKVITHVGLDVHAERIVIASLLGAAREPVIADIPNDEKTIRRTPPNVTTYTKKAQVRLHRRFTTLMAHGKKAPLAAVAVARELCGFTWGLMVA